MYVYMEVALNPYDGLLCSPRACAENSCQPTGTASFCDCKKCPRTYITSSNCTICQTCCLRESLSGRLLRLTRAHLTSNST